MSEPSRPAALALLAASFAALAAWSWGKWTDPLIDFGFELYVPWRLTEGEVLYRDIAYRNGPLSSYWNAALFGLFGSSIRTLIVANLAILAGISALLFHLLESSVSRRGAGVGTVVFLATCAFSQYGTVGNYNFVTPYQHGQTHGLLLGLIAVALLARARRPRGWAAAGLALGTLALTKAEVFVPGALAAAVALLLTRRTDSGVGITGPALVALAVGATLPPLIAGLLLSLSMSPGLALHGVLGNWPYLAEAILSDPFYAKTAGLDAPGTAMAAALAAITSLVGFGWILRRCDAGEPGTAPPPRRATLASFAAVVTGAGLGVAFDLPWADLARALPFGVLAVLGTSAPAALAGDPAARMRTLLGVFALGSLAKLGLHPQIQHYGFALAAPALALCTALAVGRWRGLLAGSLALAGAAAFSGALLADSNAIYRSKTYPLGTGGDAIVVAGPETSPRGVLIERLLRGFDAIAPPDATLLVMPEGAGLNYWLRRRNPTPYSLFLPTELAAHGGAERLLERMRQDPPDYVALVHRGHREFGTGPFLEDPRNGAAFLGWLRESYSPVQLLGAEPFQDPAFGIRLLRRTTAADSVSNPAN